MNPDQRQPMSEQSPETRSKNFEEVSLGYSRDVAQVEADRCLQCDDPKCIEGCPVNINIPGFIQQIQDGQLKSAYRILQEKTALPAVCGRVCPQENQCEAKCILGKRGDSVAIGRLERFVADWARGRDFHGKKSVAEPTGKKVAVVGSGPSGLTVAGDLIRKGHSVTVHEAFHEPGGVLIYGIPEFRLPKSIVSYEIQKLKDEGVNFEMNSAIGQTETIDELLEENDAVYVGVGAGFPKFPGIPGESLIGIHSANEYLTRVNLMKAYQPDYETPLLQGTNVSVLGGGNVAMDAARTAIRTGAKNVKLIYRRGMEEIPARQEELHHAIEEGLELCLLTLPTRFIGDEKHQIKAIECVKMQLSEVDDSGRRQPIPIPDSNYEIETDLVILAIGSEASPLITRCTPGLELNERGYIVADAETGLTQKPRVWAGGDIVTGAATVISAMGAGRDAANSIHEFLSS